MLDLCCRLHRHEQFLYDCAVIAARQLEQSPMEILAPTSPDVKRYQRQKLIVLVTGTAIALIWLCLTAFQFGPQVGHWLTDLLGEQRWLRLWAVAGLLGISLELLTLPIDFHSSYILEHRYQLSNQTLGRWIVRRLKGYTVGGILGLLLLSGLYALLWTTGDWWWLWATAGWFLVSLVLGQLLPVLILPLFYKVVPLTDSALLERLRALTSGTTLSIQGIYRLELSKETRKANAALAGLGRTRRVLLGDTLLEQFTPEEIEIVFAHEVGHHVHRHLVKMIAVKVVLSLVGFFLVDAFLRTAAVGLGYTSYSDAAALPLVLLVLTLFGLVLSPAENALSRLFERQCDRYALDRTANAAAYRSAFIKLAKINKSDADPNPIVAWLFYDHPPIRERLAIAGHESDALS